MKLFKHSSGMIVAFGFNMQKRVEDSRVISWCDPSGEWEPEATNQAGWNQMPCLVAPEFIFERGEEIVAYQPGRCILMRYIGPPLVWGFCTMFPESPCQIAA